MSNGSSPCPSVTLPFGVFAGTNTIDPLDPTDFPPADPPPNLEQFIIDNAPTDASPADGFDVAFTETVGIVDALDSALGDMEGSLLLAFGEADTIDAQPVSATVDGFTGSLAPSSSSVDALGTLLVSSSPPSPTVGGGVGPTQCGTLDFGTVAAQGPIGTNFFNHTVYLQNTGSVPLTIKSSSWSPDLGFAFALVPPVDGAVIQPGQQFAITVRVGSDTLGTLTSTLTLHTDAPDPQPCMTVTANFVPGTPPHPPKPSCPLGGVVFPGKHVRITAFCA